MPRIDINLVLAVIEDHANSYFELARTTSEDDQHNVERIGRAVNGVGMSIKMLLVKPRDLVDWPEPKFVAMGDSGQQLNPDRVTKLAEAIKQEMTIAETIKLVEALGMFEAPNEFFDWIKTNKRSVLSGMTNREVDEFTKLLGAAQGFTPN